MKIASCFCAIVILALAGVTASKAEGSSSDTEKAIKALEQKWSDAQLANKIELSTPLFADKFFLTESDGAVVDRAAFIAAEKDTHYTSSELSDVKVFVYGDAAVASYSLHQKYTSKGKTSDTVTQETDTWVKMPGGAWQLVAAHGSKKKT